jgi:hypothetical protein
MARLVHILSTYYNTPTPHTDQSILSSHMVALCHNRTAGVEMCMDTFAFLLFSSHTLHDPPFPGHLYRYISWALRMDATIYNSTVYMFKEVENIILRCAPVEMYVAVDLRVAKHMFQCIVRNGVIRSYININAKTINPQTFQYLWVEFVVEVFQLLHQIPFHRNACIS